jgi:hypothetical protein
MRLPFDPIISLSQICSVVIPPSLHANIFVLSFFVIDCDE